jgi:hypothetical protein
VVTKSNRPTALSISVLPDAILGLAESQGHRDEVAAHLPVDGEQGGQRVPHRRRPVAICVPIGHTDDLGNRRDPRPARPARPEDRPDE